jgi:hypothetical protein
VAIFQPPSITVSSAADLVTSKWAGQALQQARIHKLCNIPSVSVTPGAFAGVLRKAS